MPHQLPRAGWVPQKIAGWMRSLPGMLAPSWLNRNQKLFMYNGVLYNSTYAITTGMFLSGFFLFLGASDFWVGFLGNSNSWALLLSVAASYLFERARSRKSFLLRTYIVFRLLICLMVFVPLLFGFNSLTIGITGVMTILGNIVYCVFGTGYVVFMMENVPAQTRNPFIYIRMLWIRVALTVLPLLMGYMLNWFNKGYAGFLVVYSLALLISIADIIILLKVEETVKPEEKKAKSSITMAVLLEPWKNRPYTRYLLFYFTYFLSLTITSSYTSVFLLKYIGISYGSLSLLNTGMFLVMITLTNFWRMLEARKGHWFVLKISAFLAACEFLFYGFITRNTTWLLFITPIVAGIGNSGFSPSLMTCRYEIMPTVGKAVYEGWFGVITGATSLLGTLIGGFLLELLPKFTNSVFMFSNFQILYLFSACGAFISLLIFFNGKKALTKIKSTSMEP